MTQERTEPADVSAANRPTANEAPWFGPEAQDLAQTVEQVRLTFGDNSFQYADSLLKLGDAYMVDGLTAHPQAMRAYEEAVRAMQDNPGFKGYALDKLSVVKERSGDLPGAVQDLQSALDLWKALPQPSATVQPDYISTRERDLRGMQDVIRVQTRRPADSR